MSPQKYWNKIYRIAALSAVGLALAGVIFAFLPKVMQFRSYQQTKADLEKDIRAKEENIKELRLDQERFSTDKLFVQKMAHEIGYAHKDEMIFQFNEKSNSTPEAANE